MNKIKTKFSQWIPFVFALVISIVTIIVYTVVTDDVDFIVYVEVTAASFVPAIFPILSILTKTKYPIIINALITIHIILAVNLGTAMDFYHRFANWDLIMHGYFGFVGGATLYVLMLSWDFENVNRNGIFMMIFLGVLGCAAVWEILEYTSDIIFNGDAQRVHEALELGISPIKDTMTDIIIAIPGVALFYLGLFFDKLSGYKVSRKIYAQVKNDCKQL